MAISFTYATLKTAITSEVEETGDEFDTFLDTIIALGETKVLKDLGLTIFNTVDTGAFTQNSPFLTRDDDVVGVEAFHYIDGSGNRQELLPRSYSFCVDYWPKYTTYTATPKYYCAYSDTQWMIVGVPSSALSYEMRQIIRPTGLASDNTTTWLGTNAGDVLLWACLLEAEAFLLADERLPVWKEKYDMALSSALVEFAAERQSRYP